MKKKKKKRPQSLTNLVELYILPQSVFSPGALYDPSSTGFVPQVQKTGAQEGDV